MVISAIEHPAVTEPARFLQRIGFPLTIVPCDRQGVVQPERVVEALREDTVLVSIMHANNEVGTIQPIAQIAAHCRARGILVHCDAAQSVGKIRVHVDELGVDLLSLAGHKFYGPKGVGALYVRRGTLLEPLVHGAGHEWGLRAGTENVAGIVGLGAAARLAARAPDEISPRLETLRDQLWNLLQDSIGQELLCHGAGAPRLPNTLSVGFPGVSGQQLLERADQLCASVGSACHSAGHVASPTLAAMGVPAEHARGTVRLSLGWQTSQDDIQRAADLLVEAYQALRKPGGGGEERSQ